MELFEFLESKKVSRFPDVRLDRQSRAVDYDPGGAGKSGNFMYYDPFRTRKMDQFSAVRVSKLLIRYPVTYSAGASTVMRLWRRSHMMPIETITEMVVSHHHL